MYCVKTMTPSRPRTISATAIATTWSQLIPFPPLEGLGGAGPIGRLQVLEESQPRPALHLSSAQQGRFSSPQSRHAMFNRFALFFLRNLNSHVYFACGERRASGGDPREVERGLCRGRDRVCAPNRRRGMVLL